MLLRHPPCNRTPSPRFAKYFVENGTNRRHLFKVFGIRFDILVDGKVSDGVRGGQRHALGPVSAPGAPVVTDDCRWVGFLRQFSSLHMGVGTVEGGLPAVTTLPHYLPGSR